MKKPSRVGSFILGSLTTAALLLGVQGYRQAPRTLSASAPSSSIVFSTAAPAAVTRTAKPTAKPTARPTSAPARAKTAAPARTVRSLPITTSAPRSATARPSTYYVINMSSGVFHRPDCSNAHAITQAKKKTGYFNRADLIREGYRPCQNCDP